MSVNRQVVKKSRLLRLLVKAGKDRRQMVRQLCHAPYLNRLAPNLRDAADALICSFAWSGARQGHKYWAPQYKELLACQ